MSLGITLLLLTAAQAKAEWATYHGGFSLDGVTDAKLPAAPKRLWRFKVGEPVEFTPVSAGGRIFFTTTKGSIHALDLAGNKVWTAKIAKDILTAPPLVTDGMVIVGSDNGILYAFCTGCGSEKWKYELGDSIQGTANRVELPGGKKAIVAVSQSDGAIHCINLDGTLRWKTGELERSDGSAGVGGGRIVMGSCASALHVFTVAKAGKTADIELGGDCQVAGGVAMSGSTAYAGTRSGKVVAVDVAAGKIVWTDEDSQSESFSTPAVDATRVLFASQDGKVYSLNRKNGKKAWAFDTGGSPSSPVIAGDKAVVSADGELFLLDLKSGKKLWSAEVSDEITSPAIVGSMILVGGDDGTVTAYGAK